ncbi:MAG: hypothetical protein NUV69_01485 [Candidatus Curtissbacteria bacterium]|nr:hypothetical protein [Candidatus Curtissbacteria bacterium]
MEEYPTWKRYSSGAYKSWQQLCKAQFKWYDDNSVLAVIPQLSERVITGPVRTLIIKNKIDTIDKLLERDRNSIIGLRDVGPGSASLITAIYDVAHFQRLQLNSGK